MNVMKVLCNKSRLMHMENEAGWWTNFLLTYASSPYDSQSAQAASRAAKDFYRSVSLQLLMLTFKDAWLSFLLRRFSPTQNNTKRFISEKNAPDDLFAKHTSARRVQQHGTAEMVIENFCARALLEQVWVFSFYRLFLTIQLYRSRLPDRQEFCDAKWKLIKLKVFAESI